MVVVLVVDACSLVVSASFADTTMTPFGVNGFPGGPLSFLSTVEAVWVAQVWRNDSANMIGPMRTQPVMKY